MCVSYSSLHFLGATAFTSQWSVSQASVGLHGQDYDAYVVVEFASSDLENLQSNVQRPSCEPSAAAAAAEASPAASLIHT